jgi:hypothetical protein
MTAACVAAGGLALALLVLLLRRIISPTRFGQAMGGVAIGILIAVGVTSAGSGHG